MRRYKNWLSSRQPGLTCVHIPIGAYRAPERLPEAQASELLFFSTLAPYKGLEVLLPAYASLLPNYPQLKLTIAGAVHPRFPGYGESLCREYVRLPGVRWLGQVPEEQIRSLFAGAQVIILPYQASTGSSSVLYQAAMWGRPLVASDLPEIQSLSEESGLEVEQFKTDSTTSLAEAIRSLLDSPQSRRDQAERNYAAIQRRRPEATCLAYLQAFNLALEAHRCSKRFDIPAYLPSELA
jgi:glycosyltransferase involved in cell wall biosynthesis